MNVVLCLFLLWTVVIGCVPPLSKSISSDSIAVSDNHHNCGTSTSTTSSSVVEQTDYRRLGSRALITSTPPPPPPPPPSPPSPSDVSEQSYVFTAFEAARKRIMTAIEQGKFKRCHYFPQHAKDEFFDKKWNPILHETVASTMGPVLVYNPCITTYNLGNSLGSYLNEIACAMTANITLLVGVKVWDYPNMPIEYKGPSSGQNFRPPGHQYPVTFLHALPHIFYPNAHGYASFPPLRSADATAPTSTTPSLSSQHSSASNSSTSDGKSSSKGVSSSPAGRARRGLLLDTTVASAGRAGVAFGGAGSSTSPVRGADADSGSTGTKDSRRGASRPQQKEQQQQQQQQQQVAAHKPHQIVASATTGTSATARLRAGGSSGPRLQTPGGPTGRAKQAARGSSSSSSSSSSGNGHIGVPPPDHEALMNEVRTQCACEKYCWRESGAAWTRQPQLLKRLINTALDAHMAGAGAGTRAGTVGNGSVSTLGGGGLRGGGGAPAAVTGEASSSSPSLSSPARTPVAEVVRAAGGVKDLCSAPPGTSLPVVPDAAVHYRCGDTVPSTVYGFLPFAAVRNLIPADAQHIYVLTDPPGRVKIMTGEVHRFAQNCRPMLEALFEYLVEAFPKAVVLVKSGGDPFEDVYRIARARVAICSSSTFCLWPALASTGKAYFPVTSLVAGWPEQKDATHPQTPQGSKGGGHSGVNNKPGAGPAHGPGQPGTRGPRQMTAVRLPDLGPNFSWLYEPRIVTEFTASTTIQQVLEVLKRDVGPAVT